MKVPVALQLYTLRNETDKDFVEVLEKVAAIGYKGVEFAGYGELSAKELKSNLDRLNLKAAGSHVGSELLINRLDEVIEYNIVIGNEYIVCMNKENKTRAECEKAASVFNSIGEKIAQKGLKLCYHNHAYEFNKVDDEYFLDLLYGLTDPKLLQAEIDTYWVQYAGVDPAEYISKYNGRCPLVHFKDMTSGNDRTFTEVGNGIMDFEAIAKTAAEGGTEWFIVEQDVCRRPPLESVKLSFENLKKMGLA